MSGSCVRLHKDVSSGGASRWPPFLHRRSLRQKRVATPALVDQSAGHIRQRVSPRPNTKRINIFDLRALGIVHRWRVAVGPGHGQSRRHALRAVPAGRRAVRPQSGSDGNSRTAEIRRTQSRNANVRGRLVLGRPRRHGICYVDYGDVRQSDREKGGRDTCSCCPRCS